MAVRFLGKPLGFSESPAAGDANKPSRPTLRTFFGLAGDRDPAGPKRGMFLGTFPRNIPRTSRFCGVFPLGRQVSWEATGLFGIPGRRRRKQTQPAHSQNVFRVGWRQGSGRAQKGDVPSVGGWLGYRRVFGALLFRGSCRATAVSCHALLLLACPGTSPVPAGFAGFFPLGRQVFWEAAGLFGIPGRRRRKQTQPAHSQNVFRLWRRQLRMSFCNPGVLYQCP